MSQTTVAEDRDWMRQRHCSEESAALFYPERGQVPARAKDICGGCPVKAECLDYSIEMRDWEGVWGGVPGRKRRAIARARGIQVDL